MANDNTLVIADSGKSLIDLQTLIEDPQSLFTVEAQVNSRAVVCTGAGAVAEGPDFLFCGSTKNAGINTIALAVSNGTTGEISIGPAEPESGNQTAFEIATSYTIRDLAGNVGDVTIANGEVANLYCDSQIGNVVIERGGLLRTVDSYGRYAEVYGTIEVRGRLDASDAKLEGLHIYGENIAGSGPMVNPMFPFVEYVADSDFILNVGANQAEGCYILADGLAERLAEDDACEITVDGVKCGTISLAQGIIIGDTEYTASLQPLAPVYDYTQSHNLSDSTENYAVVLTVRKVGKQGESKSSETVLSGLKVAAFYGSALATDANGKILNKASSSSAVTVNGNVSVTVENATVTSLYGAGAGVGATHNGDVAIDFVSGKIATLYGGAGAGGVLNGDVSITLDAANAKGVRTVYAGGNQSTSNGDAVVTFSAGECSFTGTVNGMGKGSKSLFTGESSLVFDGTTGKFKGTVRDFDKVVLSGAAAVTFTKGQQKSMRNAEYEFVITADSVSDAEAMLTWNSKAVFDQVTVTLDAAAEGDYVLLASRYFKNGDSFDLDSVKVVNADGEAVTKLLYDLDYSFDRKQGGSVSLHSNGLTLNIDKKTQLESPVVLTGADETVNIASRIAVDEAIRTSGGNDTLDLGAGALLRGAVDMGDGNDTVWLRSGSSLTGKLDLGNGCNFLNVDAGQADEVEFAAGSQNTVTLADGLLNTVLAHEGSSNRIVINEGSSVLAYTAESGTNNVIDLRQGSIGFIELGDTGFNEINLDGRIGSEQEISGTLGFVTGSLDFSGFGGVNMITVGSNCEMDSLRLGANDVVVSLADGWEIQTVNGQRTIQRTAPVTLAAALA